MLQYSKTYFNLIVSFYAIINIVSSDCIYSEKNVNAMCTNISDIKNINGHLNVSGC